MLRHFKLLAHLFEKFLGNTQSMIDCKILRPWLNLIFNPLRQFILLIWFFISSIRENHKSIIIFGSKNSSNTLASLPHSIKSQEIIFLDIKVLFEKTHSGIQISWKGILIWNSKDDHTPSVVTSKIYSFGNLAPCNTEKYSTSSAITSLLIIF